MTTQTTSMTEMPEQIGPFLVKEQIGQGGMGVVFRAEHFETGQSVAIKILNEKSSTDTTVNERFTREIDILKKCQHPNIVRSLGTGAIHDRKFYIMEFVENGSVADLLKKKRKQSWQKVIGCGIQVAKALEYAHGKGIIHRDLKPANLMIDKKGYIKLADFGIARDMHESALTQTGKTVGTLAYMSPEQITGKSLVTPRSDIYALGCVLYEMLTGQPPFTGENEVEVLFKHIQDEPPQISVLAPETPVWLSKLIHSMLEKDANERPWDAPFLIMKLNEIPKKVEDQEARLLKSTKQGKSLLTARYDKKERLKKKKKNSTNQKGAFYEQSWFLVLTLVLVFGGIAGIVQYSRSEGRLYTRAAEAMASSNPSDWTRVEGDLIALQTRFPESQHATEITGWLDQIGMHRAERKIETNVRFGRDPQSEAERLYVEAQQFEKFGDRLTSLEKYEAMQHVLTNNDDNRPFLNLARQQSEKIKTAVGSTSDRTEFVKEQLDLAAKLEQEGKTIGSKKKLQAIIRLYGNNPEFDSLTEQARTQLKEL